MKLLRTLLLGFAITGVTAGVARDAYAVGASTGRVVGNVIEQTSQAPVPGALVELSGGSGVHAKTQTQEDGTFELLAIPPGTYNLVLSYEGLKPVKRKVVVQPDAATPVNIIWTAESTQEETTVVEEERHLTNPDSPQTGQVYSTTRQNQLPMARSYTAVATQIPGVTTNGGNPTVKGGRQTGNHYRVNGLDLTDPVSGTFSANFQQDALETVHVETGGFEAKDNALGSLIQVQTKRGTNEFHGTTSAYWAPTALVDYDTFGPYTYDGNKPWDYSAQRPTQGRYELNANVQGPIIKNHIFFNVGIGYQRAIAVAPAAPPRSIQAPSRDFVTIQPLVGLTFVPVDEHRIHVEVSADPTTIDYVGNNASTTANRTTPYSQGYQNQGGSRLTSEWAWQANKHVSTKVMFGINQTTLDIGPQGVKGIPESDLANGVPYDFNRPLHFNADDNTSFFNTRSHTLTIRRRMQLDAAVTASGEAGGHHEAEIGVQTAAIEQRFAQAFSGGTSTQDGYFDGYGLTYEDANGGPVTTGLCDLDPNVNPGAADGNYSGTGCKTRTFRRSFSSHQTGTQFGVYIQDRFKPKKWLTILPGIRWDTGQVRATDSNVAQTVNGFGPRLSVIADITGDGKTITQVSYGRSTEMPYLVNVGTYDQDRRSFTYIEAYNKDTRRFEFQQQTGGPNGDRIRNDHVAASADEILLSARREVTNGVTARIDYTYKYLRRQNEFNEVNTIWDPSGTRVVSYRNGIPTPVNLFGFDPRSTSEYSGVDFIVDARTKVLETSGSYTLSQTWGPGGGAGAYDNPRMYPFYQSYQGADARHNIKSSTTLLLFDSLTIGVILNWRSGLALRRTVPTNDSSNFATMRAPYGYDSGNYSNTVNPGNLGQNGTLSDVRSWTTFRSPDLLTVNAMITYDFFRLIKQHIQVNLQIQNVLALQTATGVTTADGTNANTNQFGTASGRADFRTITLGVRYEF